MLEERHTRLKTCVQDWASFHAVLCNRHSIMNQLYNISMPDRDQPLHGSFDVVVKSGDQLLLLVLVPESSGLQVAPQMVQWEMVLPPCLYLCHVLVTFLVITCAV